jgi:hypothetical protein
VRATLNLYIHHIENMSVSSKFHHLFRYLLRHPPRNLLTITTLFAHSSPLPPGTRPWYVLSLHSSRRYMESRLWHTQNGQPYNNVNTHNSAFQHWSYMQNARGTNVQHEQHRPSVSVSTPFGNQSVYSSREANPGPHPIGQAGTSAAVSDHIL